jgi:pantetheine-phosphate adenylyltransferase
MKAIYPLSADPVHKGHLNNIEVALDMFDEVHVAIGINGNKKYTFNIAERQMFVEKTLETYLKDTSRVTIGVFDGLMKNYALQNGYNHIIRGVRNGNDFGFESALSSYHEQYGLQTILLPTKENIASFSSTLVKEVAQFGGFVNEYVHPIVKESLEKKLGNRYLVSVTGSMGSGKSTFCRNLVEYSKEHASENNGIIVNHIDIDRVVKSIYSGNNVLHKQVRQKIIENFGEEMFDANGINRKNAAKIVFNDPIKEKLWSSILAKPLMVELEETLRTMKGVVLLDAAYIVEKGLLPLTNYNVMLVNCDDEVRYERIMARDGLTRDETICRTKIQLPQDARKDKILEEQKVVNYGTIYNIDTTTDVNYKEVLESLVSKIK